MKKYILAFIASIFFSLTAAAEDTDENCTYDFNAAKPALVKKTKQFASVKKAQRDEKEKLLTQSAVFKKSGVKLEFTIGGCTNYSYSFSYSNLKQKDFTADQAFKKAIDLLKKTPTTTDGKTLAANLIEALESAAMNKIYRPPNSSYDFSCTDAQCSLDASKPGQLTVSYSSSL